MHSMSLRAWLVLLVSMWLAAGCVSPVGVNRVDPRVVHRTLTSNALSTGRLSEPSAIVFEQHNLHEMLRKDPGSALATLHEIMLNPARIDPDVLFALAEASFLWAEKGGDRVYSRAAAFYAYAFLFPEDHSKTPTPYDPRYRLACDLYNRGLTAGFEEADGSEVAVRAATWSLPFGELAVAFDGTSTEFGTRRLSHFVPVAELEVRGLRNRYRQPGIGAPVAADAHPIDPTAPRYDFLPRALKIPANVLLRIDDPRQQLRGDRFEAVLELRVGFVEQSVRIEGREVPLELEMTAYLAYMLDGPSVWERELLGFLFGDLTREETRLAGLQQYTPGRTPVVLVHGTASSAVRWAEMLNDLGNDARIRENYQFWFFQYDTGNPIPYSAALLREALRDAVQRFDPEGNDPALREIVLVGHSQGGLLVKLMAIHSGDKLWYTLARVPIDELSVEPETRDLLRKVLFVEPEPFVGRVVFIATPQRGSFRAGNRLAHFAAGFMKLPGRVMSAGVDLLTVDEDQLRGQGMKRVPSSVEHMTPGNPFLKTLASIPVADEIPAHSIIAVRGDGPPEAGNDGVVEYSSAHIDEAESELVVRSHHSVQDHPDAIEEVRRILLLHRGLE